MTVHVRIEGNVHGVGFRAYVTSGARRRNLAGEVWNARDGAVEAIFQGEEATVEQMVEDLRRGPGRVDRITTNPSQGAKTYDGFEVTSTR